MPHNRRVPEDRPVSPLRLVLAAAAMTAVMLLVAALGEWVLIPSSWVRDVDEGGVARGTALLTDVPWLESVALVWSDLTTSAVVHAFVLVVTLVLLAGRRVGPPALLVVAIGVLGWVLGAMCKVIVTRPRPDAAVVEVGSWSYPSGHATNIALGTVLLLTLLRAVRAAWIRWAATLVALVVVALTAADRVVLGVHHPSDVVVGLALGTTMAVVGLRVAQVPGPSGSAHGPKGG